MSITDAIINYRRYLKRRNYSPHTVKNYMNMLKHFVLWLDVALEEACSKEILGYIDWLLDKRLSAKTINCHLNCICCFYNYLNHEEGIRVKNPVKTGYNLKLARPLPRHLKEEEIRPLLEAMESLRDRSMFMLMLRCGIRVEELSDLTLDAIDLTRRRMQIKNGKGGKGRIVYISNDAVEALIAYLKTRKTGGSQKVFLVEKGRCGGKPISVRGIQKRIEHYARKTGVKVSCHALRHTMATQLLNASAELVTIQDLLGHSSITTTQRYCRVSNLKIQRDYFQAIEKVSQRQNIRAVCDENSSNII